MSTWKKSNDRKFHNLYQWHLVAYTYLPKTQSEQIPTRNTRNKKIITESLFELNVYRYPTIFQSSLNINCGISLKVRQNQAISPQGL